MQCVRVCHFSIFLKYCSAYELQGQIYIALADITRPSPERTSRLNRVFPPKKLVNFPPAQFGYRVDDCLPDSRIVLQDGGNDTESAKSMITKEIQQKRLWMSFVVGVALLKRNHITSSRPYPLPCVNTFIFLHLCNNE